MGILSFFFEPAGRPSILDTIQNNTENREIHFHAGGVCRILIMCLRLQLTYIRTDRVNDVNSHILSVALWYGGICIILRGIAARLQHNKILKSTVQLMHCNFKAKMNAKCKS